MPPNLKSGAPACVAKEHPEASGLRLADSKRGDGVQPPPLWARVKVPPAPPTLLVPLVSLRDAYRAEVERCDRILALTSITEQSRKCHTEQRRAARRLYLAITPMVQNELELRT